MVQESTMICFDNSDYQRNGDYFPTRLIVQKDCVNLICLNKMRLNPENCVGLMTIAGTIEILVTLTGEVGRIFSKMHSIQPKGELNMLTGIRIAHLVLKHRQSKNHRMRIIVFVGSPLNIEEAELVKLGKRLKKEKVNVDIVSYGAHNNDALLTTFMNVLNGRDGSNGSHLVSVPRGFLLSDAILTSPIIVGNEGSNVGSTGGSGLDFGMDPNEDPELALALRMSLEEQHHRDEENRLALLADESTTGGVNANVMRGTGTGPSGSAANRNTALPGGNDSDEEMLQRAITLSLQIPGDNLQDFNNMSEEEQIAFAMQMSMQDEDIENANQPETENTDDSTNMEVTTDADATDAEYLQSVLENLPGVDPQSEAVRNAVDALNPNKNGSKGKDQNNNGASKK